MKVAKWLFGSTQKELDWRRIGRVVWVLISKYLDFFELQILWKYFRLEKPVLDILDMKEIDRRAEVLEEILLEELGPKPEDDWQNGNNYRHEVMHIAEKVGDYRWNLIEEAFLGRKKRYISKCILSKDIYELSFRGFKFSIQCPKCKNFAYITYRKKGSDILYTSLNAIGFSEGGVIYRDCICAYQKIGARNFALVEHEWGVFSRALKEFLKG
jgi:hypothetical protein